MKAVVRAMASVILGLLCCALSFYPRTALADPPDMQVGVDSDLVGVGDTVRLSMHVSSAEHVGQPELGRIAGFSLAGSSSGPSKSVTIINGRMTTKEGLDANWNLKAEKVGTWLIGPVTFQVGATRYRSDPIKVVVVAAGQAPHRGRNNPFGIDPFGGGGTPFDPFKGLLDSLNPNRDQDSLGTDPKLALDEPRGTVTFLHATMEPTSAVVGQQVTVSMYLYTDPNEREGNMADVHEATAADFLKRVLLEDDSSNRNVTRAMAGGHVYNVRLLRKWALFPLRAGDLVVTPMELTLVRSRLTGEPSRRSEVLTVHVTEPPAEKRPPGYKLGDVGNFALSADVSPRETDQDSAIGVTLTLSGTGNLPAMITPPAQAGVEWLPPEVHEKVGPEAGDKFGGSRTFSYVVRLHQAGSISLGAIGLPYWEPAGRAYHVARAELGTVTVKPNGSHATESLAPELLPNLPGVRTHLGGTRSPPRHLVDAHPDWFWFALGVTPVGFAFFSGASSVVKHARAKAALRAVSPARELAAKVSAAERASRGEDARAACAATARALEAATVAYASVNVRDARAGEADERLRNVGVPPETATSIDGLLAECEAARFAPDDPPLAAARERWQLARDAIARLKAVKGSS